MNPIRILAVGSTAATLLVLTACAPKTMPLPNSYRPSFAYNAPQRETGEEVAIAIMRPTWPNLPAGAQISAPDRAFEAAILDGATNILTQGGATVSGPYRSLEQMTYPQKEQADLMLTIELGTAYTFPPFQASATTNMLTGGSTTWVETPRGTCETRASVDLVLWEPLSEQRMWTKTVEIPPAARQCGLERTNNQDAGLVWATNEYAKTLEDAFDNVMMELERYFDPAEVAMVKRQSEDLRARVRY